MAKREGKKPGSGLWPLGLLVCLAAAAAAYYFASGRWAGVGPPKTKPPARPPVVSVTEQRAFVVYLPKETKDGFILTPKSSAFDGKGSILDAAVSSLLATNKQGGILANLIPAGTRLLGPIKVQGQVATVNLSKEFVENFSGGSDQEALTLNAVVATVVGNSRGGVKRVRILVDGKSVDSLCGHFDMTEPLAPDPEIVKSEKGR